MKMKNGIKSLYVAPAVVIGRVMVEGMMAVTVRAVNAGGIELTDWETGDTQSVGDGEVSVF